jgi:hypothetical protein
VARQGNCSWQRKNRHFHPVSDSGLLKHHLLTNTRSFIPHVRSHQILLRNKSIWAGIVVKYHPRLDSFTCTPYSKETNSVKCTSPFRCFESINIRCIRNLGTRLAKMSSCFCCGRSIPHSSHTFSYLSPTVFLSSASLPAAVASLLCTPILERWCLELHICFHFASL